MMLIQAMKKVKALTLKAEDLRNKVALHCADLSYETPVYKDQAKEVADWIQSHGDVLKEIMKLQTAVFRTNLATNVTIELGGKQVTKTIAEWVMRRKIQAKLELDIWTKLGDRNLKEAHIAPSTTAGQATPVTIRRYYDPQERDKYKELYRTEPSIIDGVLEVVNATTVLIET